MNVIARGRGIAIVLALILVTGCATQAVPSRAPTTVAPTRSAEPSETPTESASPQPSAIPAVAWQPAAVPSPSRNSATIGIVPGGDGLIAVGSDGGFGSIVWTSADGQTWRDVTPAGFEGVGIASVVEYDGLLVGVGRGNTIDVDAQEAAVYLSEDGLAWRKVETAEQLIGQMIDVVATDDGLYAVGGVPGADSAGIWRSTNGETWERTGPDVDHAFLWAITEGGPGLVAVGWRRNPDPDLAVWTSTDGVEWTLAPDPEAGEGFEATDVVAHDGTLVMTGSSLAGQNGRIWTSADALDWRLADISSAGLDDAYARTLITTPAGIVGVGGTQEMQGAAWLSRDGRSWQPLGEREPNAYFSGAVATEEGLLVTGATQHGTLETGIEAYAAIWSAALTD